MPSIFKSAAALAMAGAAFANPMDKRYSPDQCAAAVTGKAALGDDKLRKEHCSSFFKTIITPAAITVTTTITDKPEPTGWNQWQKKDVTVCPNEVPNYASACDEKGYRSACNGWGVTYETTFTIPASTTTKSVYVYNGGKDNTCKDGTATTTKTVTVDGPGKSGYSSYATTVTVTADPKTVTVTVPAGDKGSSTTTYSASTTASTTTSTRGSRPSACLTESKAKEFTDAFKNLLEYTNLGSNATGNGPYNYNVSAKYLAEDFADWSDSINWMAHLPQGSLTFPNRAVFDSQQGGTQAPLKIMSESVYFGCDHITWRWTARTSSYAMVTGINHFILTKDLSQIQTNYAEFNNALWIDSFKSQVPTINCVVPQQQGGSSSGGSQRRHISY